MPGESPLARSLRGERFAVCADDIILSSGLLLVEKRFVYLYAFLSRNHHKGLNWLPR